MITNFSTENNLIESFSFKPYIRGDQIYFYGSINEVNSGAIFFTSKQLPISNGTFYLKIEVFPLGGIESIDIISSEQINEAVNDGDRSLIYFLPLCEVENNSIGSFYFDHSINFYKIYDNLPKRSSFKSSEDLDLNLFKKKYDKDNNKDSLEASRKRNSENKIKIFKRKGGGFHCFAVIFKKEYEKSETIFKSRNFINFFEESPSLKKETKWFGTDGKGGLEQDIIEGNDRERFIQEEDGEISTEYRRLLEISSLGIYDKKNKTYLPFLEKGEKPSFFVSTTKEQYYAFQKDINNLDPAE